MTAAGRILLLLTAFPMAVSGGVAGPQEPGVKSVLDKEVQRLARQTEKLRGLRFRWPVAYGVESRAHLRERMVSLVKEEWGHTGIEKMGSVLRAFRLIPPDLDLAGLLADLFTEQIAGFYDPKEKKLFLTQDGNASSSPLEGVVSKLLNLKLADLILVHELTHALDDQYFDLSRLEQGARGLEDGSVALQALEEGVATLTMMLYVLDR
ncbi:MAG: hypothetical protein ACE5ID_12655, partial [Acidobacteriota bacterium]